MKKARAGQKLTMIFLAVMMVITSIPFIGIQTTYADTVDGTLLSGDELDGVKVRIRPTGSFKPLSINDDGDGNQNCVHLYYQGKSSQFYLEKADEDSYYIYFL